MPSPFPGMDPYLEDPNIFPNLHDKLIMYMEEFIQPQLPEAYYAKASQRVWLEYAEGSRINKDNVGKLFADFPKDYDFPQTYRKILE